MTNMWTLARAWGQKGHDIVALIAENHLTASTKHSVDSLLGGKSMVYWANWLDNASHTPDFSYSKTWHYKNIDEEYNFDNAPKIPEGNIVDAVKEQIALLISSETPDSIKSLALKMVVHFVGDIHQPMHLGHATDRGGNSHQVNFFGSPSNLHSIWDTDILESAHRWSHTEWQREIDNVSEVEQKKLLQDGSPESWGKETYVLASEIYETTPEGLDIEYRYVEKQVKIIELQLLKGGLRLADLLNSIFDPHYVPLNSIIIR